MSTISAPLPSRLRQLISLACLQAKHSSELAELASQVEAKESELASATEQLSASQAAVQKAEQVRFLFITDTGPD